MMRYIPADVFDCVSTHLEITEKIQLGKVCKDTLFLARRGNTLLKDKSFLTIRTISEEMLRVHDILTDKQKRHIICKSIAENVLESSISYSIINTICTSYYQFTGHICHDDIVEDMLEKIVQGIAITNREQEIWEVFQHFWLGNDFYSSVFLSSNKTNTTVLIQMFSNFKATITIMKSGKENIARDIIVTDVDKIVSFIWESCGKKFFLDAEVTSTQVVREYNVSKTPHSFDRLYHVYLHLKEVQHPFFKVNEDMQKKLCTKLT
jgi:hypothetical protein